MNEVTTSRIVRYAAAAALGMLALFLLVQTFDVLARFGEGENPQLHTITVNGEGRSSATPDIARVTFMVQQNASEVKVAQDSATKKTVEALAALKELGIEDADVKTMDYSVYPQYAAAASTPCFPGGYCPPQTSNRITGYQVSQSVEVTIRDTAKAGDVLQKLGTIGVQNIQGPNFTVDDDEGVMSEARAKAIQNAHDKAEQLAKELGVSLGDVVSYSDQNGFYPYAYGKGGGGMDMAVAQTASPALPVGSDERTVNVQVTYRIK